MEAIKKTILLNQFYSRRKGIIPYIGMENDGYNPGLNWGKIPYSIDFNKLAREPGAINLYGTGIRKLGLMSYAELMKEYHRIESDEVKYNELSDEEIEKLRSIKEFVDAKTIIDMPTQPVDPCCDPCAIPSPQPQYDMDDGDYYVNNVTANINVFIAQSANIIGAYTFAAKDWVGGKRYFTGDRVIYDGKTFKLREFSEATTTLTNGLMKGKFITTTDLATLEGTQYEGLTEDVFSEYVVNNPSEIVSLGYIYAKCGNTYYIRPSWGGYNNKFDGKVYFDELLNPRDPDLGFATFGQYKTTHWEVDDKILSHGSYTVTPGLRIGHSQDRSIGFSDITIEDCIWESKLVNFKRPTKSITDDGEELPGKFNSSADTMLDLQYIVGTAKNIDTTGEVVIGDYLNRIIFPNFTLNPGDALDNNHSMAEGTTGKVTFEYYVGADLVLDSDENYVYAGGDKPIVYRDTFNYEVKSGSAIINGETKNYRYVEIDYDSASETVTYENLDNYHSDAILSEITVKPQSMTEGGDPVSPNFQNSPYFMEDYQLGLSFVANNNANVYIDRGNATAFERHMRLSEVDTLDDLVNYGNGMFKMKQ